METKICSGCTRGVRIHSSYMWCDDCENQYQKRGKVQALEEKLKVKITDENLEDDIKLLTQLAEEMSGGMPPKILRYALELKRLKKELQESKTEYTNLRAELNDELHRNTLLNDRIMLLNDRNAELEVVKLLNEQAKGPQPPTKQKHKLLAYRLHSSSHGEHGYLYGQVYHFKADDLFTTEWERVPPADLEWEE